MIYRPSDCGCGAYERPPRPHPQCCCVPFCCSPWQRADYRPEYPQPVPPMPRPGGSLQILSTVNTTPQTVAAGGTLPFTTNTVSYGNTITHSGTSPNVVITAPGIYRVDFDGVTTPLTTAELTDPVALQLTLNGSPVPGATASQTYAAATDEATLGFHSVIEVSTVPATLSITSPSGAIVSDSTLTVERLGSVPAPVIPPLTQTPYYSL